MSEEQYNEETEVEGHHRRGSNPRFSANDEPQDEVEGHGTRASGTRASANDEPGTEDDEVEGHVSKASIPKYS